MANLRRASVASSENSGEQQKKDLWNSMLDSVASGKRLPEKNLLLLGGNPESQREMLDILAGDQRRNDFETHTPISNNFALGYTYYDVLDADHEDVLARISLYLLSTPSPAFASLLTPLLTPTTIPHTLVVILLDWNEPHLWLRRLREWILLLRTVLQDLGPDAADAMEEVMSPWRHRGRDGSGIGLDGHSNAVGGANGGASAAAAGGGGGAGGAAATGVLLGEEELMVGPGEWEDALGLPLCVVCQNAQRMDSLEKNNSWKESDFDYVLQYLRTVLLRHGASLIYTTTGIPSPLPTLVHSSLGIKSALLKRQVFRHNVIDRDKILVPANWDSWGKIRVLREGFDVETASASWSEDLHRGLVATGEISPRPRSPMSGEEDAGEEDTGDEGGGGGGGGGEQEEASAIRTYEENVLDPGTGALHLPGQDVDASGLEVDSKDTQEFLEEQSRVLNALRQKADGKQQQTAAAKKEAAVVDPDPPARSQPAPDSGVSQHIGPVQFNVGGIQVDADDMIQRLKDRNSHEGSPDPGATSHAPDAKPNIETEQLQSFFSNLLKKSGP